MGPTASGYVVNDVLLDDTVRITSADIASNTRYLTAAVRVKSISDPLGPAVGRDFDFYFTRGEANYVLSAYVYGTTPVSFTLWEASHPRVQGEASADETRRLITTVTGVVDVARSEVRITMTLATVGLSAQSKPATRLQHLAASIGRTQGVPPGVSTPLKDRHGTSTASFAYAAGKTTYALGTPSCVAVGR